MREKRSFLKQSPVIKFKILFFGKFIKFSCFFKFFKICKFTTWLFMLWRLPRIFAFAKILAMTLETNFLSGVSRHFLRSVAKRSNCQCKTKTRLFVNFKNLSKSRICQIYLNLEMSIAGSDFGFFTKFFAFNVSFCVTSLKISLNSPKFATSTPSQRAKFCGK